MRTKKGKIPYDDEDRDWSWATTSQAPLKIVGKPPEVREKQGRIPLEVSEGAWTWTPDFRILASKTVRQ